jgi:hypothetical protein
MPTVATVLGRRVVIYPDDHRPAHVHVIGGGCEAIFHQNCPDGPPSSRENYGFSKAELARIAVALQRETARLCGEWRRLHGE